MIPAAFPLVAPASTLGDVFGPLASVAVLGVIVGLLFLVGLVALQSWAATHPERHVANPEADLHQGEPSATTLRPAA
jgi:hypothetical protein